MENVVIPGRNEYSHVQAITDHSMLDVRNTGECNTAVVSIAMVVAWGIYITRFNRPR